VPLVEVDPVDDPLDRLVEGAVVEHDVRRLAAELERERDVTPRELALDRLADVGGAGERDLVDPFVPDEVRPGRAVTREDVDDAGRHLCLPADVGKQERRQRRRLGGLEHDRVPARERRRDLPGQHQQREVPRHDLRRDAERLRVPAGERVLELVRPAGVVEEVRRGERKVDVRDSLIGLPPSSDSATRARASAPAGSRAIRKRDHRALGRLAALPTAERPPGRAHRVSDVLLTLLSDLRGGSTHDGESLWYNDRERRRDMLPADVEAVRYRRSNETSLARLERRA
jgi:hypothetical protein